MTELSKVADLQNGYAFKSSDYINKSDTLNFRMSNIRPNGNVDLNYNPRYLPDKFSETYKEFLLKDGDVVIAMTDMANDPKILGLPTIVDTLGKKVLLNQRVGKFSKIDTKKVIIPYLKYALSTDEVKKYYKSLGGGGVQINIGKNDILSVKIPLPSLEIQKQMVKEIEKEGEVISVNRQLIEAMENKISTVLSEV